MKHWLLLTKMTLTILVKYTYDEFCAFSNVIKVFARFPHDPSQLTGLAGLHGLNGLNGLSGLTGRTGRMRRTLSVESQRHHALTAQCATTLFGDKRRHVGRSRFSYIVGVREMLLRLLECIGSLWNDSGVYGTQREDIFKSLHVGSL